MQRGGIRIKLSPLQGKKVAAKIIHVEEHILTCVKKTPKKSLTNNFTLQRPDPP